MIIVRNRLIPFPGFSAINLFGILFVRKDAKVTERTLNHERIHTAQMIEMLFIFFYIWYLVEWIIKIFIYGPSQAYYEIGFEKEAYKWDNDFEYLEKKRRRFAWIKEL